MTFRPFLTGVKFSHTLNIHVVDINKALISDATASTTWPEPTSQSLDEFRLNVTSNSPTEYSLRAYLF